VFGAAAATLLKVDVPGEISIRGAISPPDGHRAARGGLVLGVNGRRIHNRALLFAAEEAYRGVIPTGRHPFGVLHIELSGDEVDVNVHPAKREVRFREEGRVFTAVQRACWATLQGAPIPTGLGGGGGYGPDRSARGYAIAERPAGGGYGSAPLPPPGSAGAWAHRPDRPTPAQVEAALTLHLPPASDPGVAPPVHLRALGQAGAEWLVAHSAGDVVLIDPHAAHEKILYAELLGRWEERDGPDGGAAAQLLLVPALIDCDAGRMECYATHAELIAGCGLELEPFGPGTLRCTAVPAGCGGGDVTVMIADLLDGLEEEGGGEAERRHRLAATVACHAAVRFGDPLGEQEQQGLLDRLVVTPGWMTCPHGRPTMLRLEQAALRRAFRRPAD